jgi:hypothetical protein
LLEWKNEEYYNGLDMQQFKRREEETVTDFFLREISSKVSTQKA